MILWILLAIAAIPLAALCFYSGRLRTMRGIKLSERTREGFLLFYMEVHYNYHLLRAIKRCGRSLDSFVNAIRKSALPLVPVKIDTSRYACSVVSQTCSCGYHCMGRNYDFTGDTNVMMVRCHPRKGYASMALSPLSFIDNNWLQSKAACLLLPFGCVDGINEKGVSIAVLMLDSPPTVQNTGKYALATTMAVRLVLDHAATTQEAVDLLKSYDMFALGKADYQFAISDSIGDARVVSYDCEDENRPMLVTPFEVVTNFFLPYKDKVLPNQQNGIYGHGRERYDHLLAEINRDRSYVTPYSIQLLMDHAEQDPSKNEKKIGTQWSVVYNNSTCTAEIILHRQYGKPLSFRMFDDRPKGCRS